MLIIGAKGFAKEILEVFHQNNKLDDIAFYDDVNNDIGNTLFDTFPVLKNIDEAKSFFLTNGTDFTIGVGNPYTRVELYNKFIDIGGTFCSAISPLADIGHYDVTIGEGSNVLSNAVFSNTSSIGKGCIVYYNVLITHDCEVGDFVELSPNAVLLGNVKVGDFSHICTNATILPNVTIGKGVIIGAGSVVTRDIPDNTMAYGIPAKVVKELNK